MRPSAAMASGARSFGSIRKAQGRSGRRFAEAGEGTGLHDRQVLLFRLGFEGGGEIGVCDVVAEGGLADFLRVKDAVRRTEAASGIVNELQRP